MEETENVMIDLKSRFEALYIFVEMPIKDCDVEAIDCFLKSCK